MKTIKITLIISPLLLLLFLFLNNQQKEVLQQDSAYVSKSTLDNSTKSPTKQFINESNELLINNENENENAQFLRDREHQVLELSQISKEDAEFLAAVEKENQKSNEFKETGKRFKPEEITDLTTFDKDNAPPPTLEEMEFIEKVEQANLEYDAKKESLTDSYSIAD